MADLSTQQATLKEDYNLTKKPISNLPKDKPIMQDKKDLQAVAKRKVLAKTLQARGGKTFKSKVEWVKKHMPEVTDPEAFVASALREVGEIK